MCFVVQLENGRLEDAKFLWFRWKSEERLYAGVSELAAFVQARMDWETGTFRPEVGDEWKLVGEQSEYWPTDADLNAHLSVACVPCAESGGATGIGSVHVAAKVVQRGPT